MFTDGRRFSGLDELRGFAACCVILQHCLELTPFIRGSVYAWAEPLQSLFQSWLNLGRFGVVLFFFISGFLIPSSLKPGDKALLNFVLSRFFRLYPLYWVSLFLAVLAFGVLGLKSFEPSVVVANLTMFQMGFGVENVLELYWTLFTELVFYIACVVLFTLGILHNKVLMSRLILLGGGAVGVTAILSISNSPAPYASLFQAASTFGSYIFLLFVGYQARIYLESKGQVPWLPLILLVCAPMLIYVVCRHFNGVFHPLLSPSSVFVSTLLALFVFLLIFTWQPNLVFTRYLGRISYGIYLFHPIALIVFAGTWGRATGLIDSIFFIAIIFSSTILTASLFCHLVEEPGIAFGKQVRKRLVYAAV